jgi:hypothetical protein
MLKGSQSAASFTLQARQRKGKKLQVQLEEDLALIWKPKGSMIDLGWWKDGVVGFVLAGKEGRYVSSNPPHAVSKTIPIAFFDIV